MDRRITDRLMELGAEKERQDAKRRALDVANDLLIRINRNGATSFEIDELESVLKAFRRAQFLQDYEVISWNSIIEKLRETLSSDDEQDEEEEEEEEGNEEDAEDVEEEDADEEEGE